jgi:hypothetical protein
VRERGVRGQNEGEQSEVIMSNGHSAATNASRKIMASVGRNAINRTSDVRVVQELLNAAGAGINHDGQCGRATISAIEEYQRNWTTLPDGRVDPVGVTWKHLSERRFKVMRAGYALLPQMSGNGYYSYSPVTSQYGTAATISSLVRCCRRFAEQNPDVPVGIGDMSLANGAEMKPHKTHRNGRNADIRPLRKDGKMLPVTIGDPQYSRERTAALVKILRADPNLKSILFNDSGIVGVTHFAGHDNHLHVSMKA